jgi:AcrR family transcriptional regulator
MSRLPASKRREQLLDRAAELFAKMGYARATTAQLAKAAGVTEPIIYRHFGSKKELFVALIERTGRQTMEAWEQHLSGDHDAAERLRLLLGDNPMVSDRGRSAYRVILQSISEVDDTDIHAALKQHIRSLHAFLAEEIQGAQESHRVTTRFSADIIAWLLIDIGLGYGVLSAMSIADHNLDPGGEHVQLVLGRILVGKDHKGEG